MWTQTMSLAKANVIISMMILQAQAAGTGQWSASIPMPIVPVAAVVVPTTGKVLTWSAYKETSFTQGTGVTQTATYDPATGLVSKRTVSETRHDMFCPGLSVGFDGRPVVTGGANATRTSIYNIDTDSWISGPDMKIPRGYQSSATLSNGKTFVIGGSWSGGQGGKNGEIYDPATNAWSLLPGCPVAPMLTDDRQGPGMKDNHGWLFGWKNGYVFQAGPSKAMNWYSTTGSGSQTAAGLRALDPHAMNGNAIMYDAAAGKILTLGGAPDYKNDPTTTNAHIITIGIPPALPTVLKIANMNFKRAHSNSVILPNGQVFITGGQTYAVQFTDANATMTPELFDPATNTFKPMAMQAIPRTYHSIGLLLPDATVLGGGGGLCGTCAYNHLDLQIFSPPYLFGADGTTKAVRPKITSVSATTIKLGATVTVKTDSDATFSIVRYGSATHSVDTDQRRIPLAATKTATGTYTITFPTDSGVALPGYWMLFALNGAGVPSVASTVKVTL